VGIGTSTPDAALEVEGTIKASTHGDGFVLGSPTTVKYKLGVYGANDLLFKDQNNNVLMALTAAGNVGISTTAPLAKLHIKDGNTLTTALPNTGALIEGFSQSILQVASHSTGYSQLAFGDQDDGFDGGLIYSNAARYLAIEAANTEQMRFTANGNVGIGTTAPQQKLHISDSDPRIRLTDTDGTDWYSDVFQQGGAIKIEARNGSNFGNISFQGNNGTTGVEYARFNSAGRLGVGTNSPNSKVHISGTAMAQLRMETSGGPTAASDTSGRVGDMAYDDNYFYIKTNNGWGRMALDFGF
jgi:hypothetical protein